MLTKKENFLETIRPGGHPDRFVKQYEALAFFPGNPVSAHVTGKRYPGMPPLKDKWGVTIVWPEGHYGSTPDPSPLSQVIKDVTCWRDFVKVPDLIANCSQDALWEPYLKQAEAIDRSEQMLMAMMPTGVFERLHFLMGFEDTLCNFLMEPEAIKDLADAVGEYRYQGMKLIVDHLHPDAVLSHDDWGSKNSLFMSPDTWREFIKPQYVKSYSYIRQQGVLLMHHADSYLEPLMEDMIELGIQVWQGVLPQNDIPKIQKQIAGRMALMGGIDAGKIDYPGVTEEEVREEVRRVIREYTPAGQFVPCITYGAPGAFFPQVDEWINDELDQCSREVFGA